MARILAPLAVAVALAAAPAAQALGNGLARTPPMGFNGWNAFGCDVGEALIEQTADYMVSSGMRDAGYEYVNIDDCWMTHGRDAEGRLVADPAKFPNGIAGTAAYVHARGLKLGIYEDAGTATCAGFPGSLGHEAIDAQTFAEWGVDYLKYDNCSNAGSTTTEEYIERYRAMGEALAATGRPIVYSICEWGVNDPWTWAGDLGHLWRTTDDISDDWDSLKSIVNANAPLAPYARPGAWNDPDMLEVGNGGMTDIEYRSHFSLWAEMAAPLLAGTDLRKATPATMAIYLNKGVIAVDQDPLGVQGAVVKSDGTHLVFAKPLAGGDVAVALFNEGDAPATMSTTVRQVGLPRAPAYAIHDLWSDATTETAGTIAAGVPAHGTAMYRVSATTRWKNPDRRRAVTADAVHPGAI
jgi:alpha-galactosidase